MAPRVFLMRAWSGLSIGVACAVLFSLGAMTSAQAASLGQLSVTPGSQDTLIFSRTSDATGQLEGVVVDSARLVETLKARVLEARGLGEVAELQPAGALSSRTSLTTTSETPYIFAHRFGAPFESLDVSLRLHPLAEPGDGAFVAALALLLAACVVLGLYALYRTTATQIEFAERRNNFVSAVSHELKTPLTAIRMYSEMLENDLVDSDSRRRDYYRTITAEGERLTRLINNVLELSRIENKPAKLELMLGDAAPVVRQALDVLRPHAEREGFVLELDVEAPLPNVHFEADALRQILFNLVDNALKYGREASERRITVRLAAASCRAGHPERVVLSVRDRGPGVEEKHLRDIFQPFFRVEQELTRKTQGTGIGLSLVRGLVERMGGTVLGANVHPGFEIRVELPGARAL